MPCQQCLEKQALLSSIRFLQSDASFLDWVSEAHPTQYAEVLAMSEGERTIVRAEIARFVMDGGAPTLGRLSPPNEAFARV